MTEEADLPLRLDFPAEDTHNTGDVPNYTLRTDSLSVSFEILSGAGGYTATAVEYDFMSSRHITQSGAVVRIDGKTVTVDMLESSADVVVSDRSGVQSHVYVNSSHPALQYFTWSKIVPYGSSTESNIYFGCGEPYRIVEYSDMNAADASVEGSLLKTGALLPGSHWYLIVDRRGTMRKFDIDVRMGYDIEEESLTVQARAGAKLTFPFKFGKGWKVVEGRTGPETFVFSGSDVRDGFRRDTFVVTVGTETASWTFLDSQGQQVKLTIEV